MDVVRAKRKHSGSHRTSLASSTRENGKLLATATSPNSSTGGGGVVHEDESVGLLNGDIKHAPPEDGDETFEDARSIESCTMQVVKINLLTKIP